ncbi:MAG: hypothetical protein LC632_03165 [Xanthomonadaceae bacterium]|nr:hypothetical protein [Xanthomonadaceae bacterium]
MLRLIIATLAVGALSACAMQRTLPTVPPSQPHGVVHAQLGQGADRTHPVEIVAINGINVPSGGSSQFLLAPGEYTLRLRPTTKLSTEIGSVGMRGRGYPAEELRLVVESGGHYTVAAHVPGPHASDWRPVVTRTDRM